ncbi:MAG: DNA polymerase III subunit delta [Candidatus Berkelbacteria bacterium]
MLYFYYGEDTYSLKKKINEIIDSFVKIEGSDFNISTLIGSKVSVQEFEKNVFTAPFLGSKRLIIIKNILLECGDLDTKKAISTNLDKVPKTSIVIFVEEGKPDKRESLFKNLTKLAIVKSYEQPSDLDIKRFIEMTVLESNFKITSAASFQLGLYCGRDYWRIENELLKLISYAKYQKKDAIVEADVTRLVDPINNFMIFDLTDALADRNVKKAIKIYYSMLESGEDEIKVFNMIIYHIRNMILVNSIYENSEYEIAKATSLHPYVVKKIMISLRKFEGSKLHQLYKRLSEVDWKIKTGLLEIGTALDLLLVDFQRS